jgi:hypothetical protein
MKKIDRIIRSIDNYLIETDKEYLTLGQANQYLLSKNLISENQKSNGYLKQLLEERQITHAIQTRSSPRQWRIPLTKEGKNRRRAKKYQEAQEAREQKKYELELKKELDEQNRLKAQREEELRIKSEKIADRPILISITSIFVFVIGIRFLSNSIFSDHLESIQRFLFICFSAISFSLSVGMWKMQAWSGYLYIGIVVIGQIILFVNSGGSLPHFILAIIMVGVVVPYLEDMN